MGIPAQVLQQEKEADELMGNPDPEDTEAEEDELDCINGFKTMVKSKYLSYTDCASPAAVKIGLLFSAYVTPNSQQRRLYRKPISRLFFFRSSMS